MVLPASGRRKSHRSYSAVLCLVLLVVTTTAQGAYTEDSEQEGAICHWGAAAEAISVHHGKSLHRESNASHGNSVYAVLMLWQYLTASQCTCAALLYARVDVCTPL